VTSVPTFVRRAREAMDVVVREMVKFGAVGAAAFVSGFLQGFLVFLAVPVDLGRPFGGLTVVGAATALLLWLWVLNAVVVVGYALTRALDARLAAQVSATGTSGAQCV
jgi:membrane protein